MKTQLVIVIYWLAVINGHSQIVGGGKDFQPRVAMTNSLNAGIGTVTVTDNFDRANANPMSTTMSGGGIWVSGPGAMNDCKIESNALVANTGVANGCRVTTPTLSSDQYSQVVLTAFVINTSAGVRLQSDSNASGYMLKVSNATTLRFFRLTDTGTIAFTQLGSDITVTTLVASDTIRLEVIGSTLTAKVNGVVQGSTTDATYTGGAPFIYLDNSSAGVLSFVGGDL